MKNLIILSFLFFAFTLNAQNSVNYICNITTIGDLNKDDYTEIKENTYISINPNEKSITFNNLERNIVMKFYYFRKTDETNQMTFNMLENKWSVTDMVVQSTNNQLSITWLYAKPNDTFIMYGPLTKQ